MLPTIRQMPLLIPSTLFLLGICVANKFAEKSPPMILLTTIILTLCFILVASLYESLFFRSDHFLFKLLSGLLLGFTGAYLYFFNDSKLKEQHLWLEKSQLYLGQIKKCKQTAYFNKCEVKIFATKMDKESWKKKIGKALVYLKKKHSLSLQNQQGALLFKTSFNQINRAPNKYAFDPRRFYKNRNITHQGFVDSQDWTFTTDEPKSFSKFLDQFGQWLNNKLQYRISNKERRAIAKAIILGDKDDLSDASSELFRHTGAMHVLAVSGLHVGMISMLSILFFNCITLFKPNLIKLRLVGTILFTWVYALITGFAPAVQRASVMASLYLASPILNIRRAAHPLNILSIAALIILLLNPFAVFTISFQLSFTALLGILILFVPLSKMIVIKKRVLNYFWQLFCISLSAQIFIAPILVYYFHEFPSYFWLSSLFAVPLAFIILGSGVLFLISDEILGPIGSLCYYILNHSIEILIALLAWVQKLPFGKMDRLWLESIDLALYYLALFFLILYTSRAKKYFFWLSLLIAFSLFGIKSIQNAQYQNRIEVQFFHAKGGSLFDVYINTDRWTFNQGISTSSESYIAENARTQSGCSNTFKIPEKASVYIPYQRGEITISSLPQYVMIRKLSDEKGEKNIILFREIDLKSARKLEQIYPDAYYIMDASTSSDIDQYFKFSTSNYHNTSYDGITTVKL